MAFLGQAGCGKSFLLSLLTRFYRPESGTVAIDGIPCDDYDITYASQVRHHPPTPTSNQVTMLKLSAPHVLADVIEYDPNMVTAAQVRAMITYLLSNK